MIYILIVFFCRFCHSELTYIVFHLPAARFETFMKLTFSNMVKKVGVVEDPESFHFNNIQYRVKDIHTLPWHMVRKRGRV